MEHAERPVSPCYASDTDSHGTMNGSSSHTSIGFSPSTNNEQDALKRVDKDNFGQFWLDSSAWNELNDILKKHFFPEVGVCRHLSEHPSQSGWYFRRLLLYGVLDSFRDRAQLDYVTAALQLDGNYGQLSVLSYHFRNGQDTDIARINITPPLMEDPFQIFQLATTWALHDALLPSYYLLSQALQWPISYNTARYCQIIDSFNASSNWRIGTPTGPYELPGSTLWLRVVPQTSTRIDLAWVRPPGEVNKNGSTYMIMEFHLLQAYPVLHERMSLHTAILLLGALTSAIMGRDVQNPHGHEDARVPLTPPRHPGREQPHTPTQ